MKKSYLSFTIGFDGGCEDVGYFEVDGVDKTESVDYSDVEKFVKKLLGVEEFFLSEHRTEVEVWWYENNKMDVYFISYNLPDDDEFDEHYLEGLEPIEFKTEKQ